MALKRSAKRLIKDEKVYKLCCYLIDTFSFKLTKDKEPIPGKTYYVSKKHKYERIKVTQFKPGRKYYEYEQKSLGLGSQTSQLFALLALNEVDHFIKEELHIKYYGRYMDDLYLLHNDSKYLAECEKKIEARLNKQGLCMNKKKTTITRISPVHENKFVMLHFKYLKWNFYLTDSNHIIQIPFKRRLRINAANLKRCTHYGYKVR